MEQINSIGRKTAKLIGSVSVAGALITLGLLQAPLEASLPPADAPKVRYRPNPFYSEEGYRLGYLYKFEDRISHHFEGSLNLGSGSSPMAILNQDCVKLQNERVKTTKNANRRQAILSGISRICLVDVNPWPFSAVATELFESFHKNPSTPMVLYYTHSIDNTVGVLANLSVPAFFAQTDNYGKFQD